jgi:hypothetical protein
MFEKEEKQHTGRAPADTASALNEKDLEAVSGGLLGITIVDTCPQKYDYGHCCDNFGRCPNLIVNSEDVHNDFQKEQTVYNYVFSCAKGYYSRVKDTRIRWRKLP